MNLLRFRRTVRDLRLELPDGTVRRVKVETDDRGGTQHVSDWEDRIHGTARPAAIGFHVNRPAPQRRPLLLRNRNGPKVRQAFAERDDHLWVPVPGTTQALEVL